MGKFLHFHQNKEHGVLNRSTTATAGKIVKRTSRYLQKQAVKLTQQAYQFHQQQQQQQQQQYTNNQHGGSLYYQQLLSPSVAGGSSAATFSTTTTATATTATLPSFSENNNEHDRFRQAYDTFLVTHDLNRENWPKSWKESLSPEHPHWMCLNSAQLQFQELLYEVVWTENTYVHDLTLAYQIFAKDALSWSELPKSLRLIFDNLVQIIRLHLGLLQELRSRQQAQHPIVRTIADIFLNYAPRFLDYYSAYFINFEKANQVVVRAMASKTDTLGVYFRTRSHWPECRNLTLQSFLLKPVQRLMKYPLFFKSLTDSLPHLDPDRITHLRTLHELKLVIQRIEVDKKESEDDRKLDDLASRIRGMPTNLVIPNRRLIYEGYLTLVPAVQAPLMRSVTKDSLGGQHYTYAPHPNVVARSHSFSSKVSPTSSPLSSSNDSNKKRLYVFLFNDMILCTKVRSKTRNINEDTISTTTNPQNYYGPTPHTLFKLTHPPGQLTFVDRSVSRIKKDDKSPTSPQSPAAALETNKPSSLFRLGGSLRRSWSTHNTTTVHPAPPQAPEYEEHPQQFICSIATRHITNYYFETTTSDEKEQWCQHLESVLESHVQRPDWLLWGSYPKESSGHGQSTINSLYNTSFRSLAAPTADTAANTRDKLLFGLAPPPPSSSPPPPPPPPTASLLHEKTQIPYHHPLDDVEMDDVDPPQQQANTSCWELKPLPTIYNNDDDSSWSSNSSIGSNRSSSDNTEKMDMFTTAASSPIHEESRFNSQRHCSSNGQPLNLDKYYVLGKEENQDQGSLPEPSTMIMHS